MRPENMTWQARHERAQRIRDAMPSYEIEELGSLYQIIDDIIETMIRLDDPGLFEEEIEDLEAHLENALEEVDYYKQEALRDLKNATRRVSRLPAL